MNQEWKFQALATGYDAVYSGSAQSLVWDDANSSTTKGSGMQLWSWSNNSNQEWTPQLLSSGLWSFSVLTSGHCLDNSGSTTIGTRMTQWTCQSGNANQQYEMVRVR